MNTSGCTVSATASTNRQCKDCDEVFKTGLKVVNVPSGVSTRVVKKTFIGRVGFHMGDFGS
ncbi:hypothetical protein GCM10007416_25850 [Kroppenstedtia guangzhouensis]|uniref:Uncharacterized protein n=1 Tax=Kroppenstedtia guangzhouensis TaxID=1274356 RepID=A0ABQ1GWS5_9BACL|nr:hypothetical protein GCM10007416_25850 [Kroppenstedtia guangzhouensis]